MNRSILTQGILAFDLEIAKSLVTDEDWKDRASMGISCASTITTNDRTPKLWFEGMDDSTYSVHPDKALPHAMSTYTAVDLASYLLDMHACGWTVVTWNGAGFDFEVLAHAVQQKRWAKEVAHLALQHVDPWYQMRAEFGYGIKLDVAARALGVGGKTEGMTGALAPILWTGILPDVGPKETQEQDRAIAKLGLKPGSRSAQELCLEYVAQDAVCTLEVYEAILKVGAFKWTTARGTLSRNPWRPRLVDVAGARHLLKVCEVLTWPEPDTSWMTKQPKPKSELVQWALDLTSTPNLIQMRLDDLLAAPENSAKPLTRQIEEIIDLPDDWPTEPPPGF